MSSKPETAFTKRVHSKFPERKMPHFEKMHNMYRGGTWDVWYSGKDGDLWVEYKVVKAWPKNGPVVPALTSLQLEWGHHRAKEGRNMMVVVGGPGGAVIFKNRSWEEGLPIVLEDIEDVATEIALQVGPKHATPQSSKRSKSRRIVL